MVVAVVLVVVVVVVSRGRQCNGQACAAALLTLAVCFLLGSVVFMECWAGLSVLLGKLQGDAIEQRRRGGGGGGESTIARGGGGGGGGGGSEGQWDTQWMDGQ